MRHSLPRMMAAGVAALLIGATDAQASALQCGDVVTEDVVLQADLLECPGDGLVVEGADVTVDLNFHRVDGTGSGAGVRVRAPGVTLRRGSIGEFGIGVHLQGAFDAPGGGSAAIRGTLIHHNTGTGILATSWNHATHIGDTVLAANGGSGIFFRDSLGASVTRSLIAGNEGAGISFEFAGGGQVQENVITRNGTWGLFANRSGGLRVLSNAITRNGRPETFSGGALIREGLTTIEDNRFIANRGVGLALDEPLESRSRWPINRNVANRNASFGIAAAQPGFTGAGNVAKNNGEPLQCSNFPCNVEKR